ncbi:MAG TPA: AMP-binding protein [Solirubrobacteraceae bacterium]|jgi:putative long chain acyl-CoA synthase|nr:AMP-binding protein [Solirubrobacteraceae bacterium]
MASRHGPPVPGFLAGPAARVGAAAQNALEVARFGGLETGEQPSPYEVVAESRIFRLRRYFPPSDGGAAAGGDEPGPSARDTGPTERAPRPAVVLVPPMMLAAEVYDVSPSASAVEILHRRRIDPFVVDFGSPEHEPGGLERNLTDHVLAVSDAVDRVRELTGRDVHLGGYSQGGMFCYQTAAYRRGAGIRSLVTFGSPVDTHGAMPFGLPEQLVAGGVGQLAERLFADRGVPAWISREGFRLLDPVKSLRQRVDFLMQLHDRDALLPRERQRRFLMADGWVAWPGPALVDFLRQFVIHNRMLSGGFVIEDRLVTLADIDLPMLCFVGSVDQIAPTPAVRAIVRAAPRAEIFERSLSVGHFGLVVGGSASRSTWPTVASWARWRDGEGRRPQGIAPMGADDAADEHGAGVLDFVGHGLVLASEFSIGATRGLAHTGARAARAVRELSREAASELPRLARLEQIGARTRISLGSLLDEQARRAPGDVLFLFEDRAHTQADAKRRIDSVVKGLISVGIRQGQHVGVLMRTRPSALALTAALSRLGAVAVLLRPDGDLQREADLGGVRVIVADPEHAELARAVRPSHVLLLGGGGGPREVGPDLLDMEQIDPDAVALPAWYEPNPGLARDLAFILFSGEGAGTRAQAITNRRWALSAFGTASSAALTSADTVYCVTPIYHTSGLLMSIAGAVAGGARLAMATRFAPDTFWEEVRRYGVTVSAYTWTLLHDLVEAPPQPGERHHPVRLFVGSGMPRGLWRRVLERFAPARVLEFWAATEADAILANLSGAKVGAMGRPLLGSAELRLASYDLHAGRLRLGPHGLALACGTGETGLLLARARGVDAGDGETLRGVFARGDAWRSTDSLFTRDVDGDYWLVDHLAALIPTARGPVAARPIVEALGDLPVVDLAVAYGVPIRPDRAEIAVAAVTLRGDRRLDGRELTAALRGLVPSERPEVVHAVAEIPVTTWYRPQARTLRAAGLPEPDGPLPAFYRVAGSGVYRPLTRAALRRLVGGVSAPLAGAVAAEQQSEP